jgi:hypothetical protein
LGQAKKYFHFARLHVDVIPIVEKVLAPAIPTLGVVIDPYHVNRHYQLCLCNERIECALRANFGGGGARWLGGPARIVFSRQPARIVFSRQPARISRGTCCSIVLLISKL